MDKDYRLFDSASSKPFGVDVFDRIRADFVDEFSKLKEDVPDDSEHLPNG